MHVDAHRGRVGFCLGEALNRFGMGGSLLQCPQGEGD